jgi:hypothetical protein
MNQNRDANERFDRLLKAMVSGPPPKPKGEPQQQAGLPEGDRRRKPGPRS